MEPTLTPPDPTDDPLDALLSTAAPSIPDDGFTARVCAALPPASADVSRPLRFMVLSGSIGLGCAIVWLIQRQADPDWLRSIADAVLTWQLRPWFALVTAAIFAIWGAIWLDGEDRSRPANRGC